MKEKVLKSGVLKINSKVSLWAGLAMGGTMILLNNHGFLKELGPVMLIPMVSYWYDAVTCEHLHNSLEKKLYENNVRELEKMNDYFEKRKLRCDKFIKRMQSIAAFSLSAYGMFAGEFIIAIPLLVSGLYANKSVKLYKQILTESDGKSSEEEKVKKLN